MVSPVSHVSLYTFTGGVLGWDEGDGWDTWLQGVGCKRHPDPLGMASSCMEACSLAHGAYLLAGSAGSALYVLRDRGCANRQCDPVADEGEIMLENILPDMGIQEVLAGDQSIDGTK
jgi:hypothetical protein